MTSTIARNRQYLTDLFAGPFRGHAIIFDAPSAPDAPAAPAPPAPAKALGDFTLSPRPVSDWLPIYAGQYTARVERQAMLDDDAVPYVNLNTNTGIFAAAFGCKLELFENSNAAARPAVFSAAEAARLPQPTVANAALLQRILAMTDVLAAHLGPDVPLSVPDIQSPFDIAAIIWDKADLFTAMVDEPAAVHELVAKCEHLLTEFLDLFLARFPQANLCHCPYAWAPRELGMWLSEDEAGSMSVAMFEEFCLPPLQRLSARYGGLFMHCCATADHQYATFRQIPHLRGLNRVFQAPGPGPAITAFAGHTVLIQAWCEPAFYHRMLDLAQPGIRFLFNLGGQPLEQVQPLYAALRARCPRG